MPKLDREKYLVSEEFRQLVNALADIDPLGFAMFAVAGLCGLRIIEVVSIRFADLLLNETPEILKVTVAKKKPRPPKLPMADTAIPKTAVIALKHYIATLPPEKRKPWMRVFPFTTRHGYRLFKAACAKAGLSDCYSPHCLRHFRGMQVYESTKDAFFTMESLRQSSINSTQVYIHTVDGMKKAAGIDI